MNYILDTHVFLWLIFEPEKLAPNKLEILASPTNNLYITTLSFWEICIKYNLGKLELQGLAPEDLPAAAKEMGISVINIGEEIMASFYKLGKFKNHKDPFDRLIIWYCICVGDKLVSRDKRFEEYKGVGLKLL
jgi:PIN domain nuclease of toxin-antitoxin system